MADRTDILVNQMKRTNFSLFDSPINLDKTSEAIDILIAEGGETFYNYVDWLGLVKEPDLVVLSSQHHYYYDPEEMNNCRTVINLKELNQIKKIKNFLHTCLNFLPQKSNFIGCFIDNEKFNGYELRRRSSYDNKKRLDDIENGIVSSVPFINMLYSLMDLRTFRYMSKMSISLMLEDYGFKVMNITELNGLSFFHSQKIQATYN